MLHKAVKRGIRPNNLDHADECKVYTFSHFKHKIYDALNRVDTLGTNVQMNYDGDKENITTSLGGLVSINYYGMFIIYCIL